MKAKTNKLQLIFLITVTFLISTFSYAQIKFKDRTLNFLQSIAFETTYDNIGPMFKAVNIIQLNQYKEKDKTETLSFKISSEKTIYLKYSEDKKLIYACFSNGLSTHAQYGYEIAKELTDNGFKSIEEKAEGMFSFYGTQYTQKGYPYEFITNGDRKVFESIYVYNPSFGHYTKFINKK